MKSYAISMGPKSNITDVLKEENRHRDMHRGKMEAEVGGRQQQAKEQAKEQQGPPGAPRS